MIRPGCWPAGGRRRTVTINRIVVAAGSAGRWRRLARAGCAVAVPLVLAACGGGGGGAKPAPTPTASCPTGTPPAAASGSPSPAVCVGTEAGGTARAWHGTITATATLLYLKGAGNRGPFTGSYTGTMSLTVGSAGAVTGHGQVSQSGCALKVPAASISFGLRGTDDGRQFRLQIPPPYLHFHGGRTGCGFGVGWLGPVPGRYQSSTSVVIPIGPAGAARAHWVVHSHVADILENTASYVVDLASG
jgi:hypothetical protein